MYYAVDGAAKEREGERVRYLWWESGWLIGGWEGGGSKHTLELREVRIEVCVWVVHQYCLRFGWQV